MSGRSSIPFALPRPDWFDQAACRGTNPALFYPDKGELGGRGNSDTPAARVCRTCLVQADCLEWALDTGELYGCWGGLSPKARRGDRGRRVLVELRRRAA